MRSFPQRVFLTTMLLLQPLAAAAVRTLAFELPAESVTFELKRLGDEAGEQSALRLEVRVNQFSTPVNLPAGRYAAVSKDFKSTDAFALPESSGTRFLLLILPKADGGCAIFPVPDDPARLRPGDRFIFNATRDEIAVRFGSQRTIIKAGHSEYLRVPRPAPSDPRIEVEMAKREKQSWVVFNSTYWPLDPRARSFVMLHPDPTTGQPRVRNLSEVPQ